MPSTLQLRSLTTPTTTIMIIPTTLSAAPTMAAAEILPSLAEELATELTVSCPFPLQEMDTVARYHNHEVGPNQCCSALVRRIPAPLDTVWRLVGRFDQPQAYKRFLRSCHVIAGDSVHVGCIREVHLVSGLPAASSTEQLEVLDYDRHVIGFRIVGGEHRLQNYRSVTTLHHSAAVDCGDGTTVVVESYVVDVPKGNTKEETCVFVDTIVRCNLHSLSQVAEKMVKKSRF